MAMSESETNFSVVVAEKQSLVLSTPESILAQLTSDVLPIAYQVKVADEQSAQPIYEQGIEFERQENYAAALSSYLKAANLGHEAAQYRVGEMLLNGFTGVEKNYSEAYDWLHRAAEQGNSDALNRLGWMCEAGLGVQRDQSRAVNWFRQAAERGHLEAQFNLGAKYDNGEGVAQNHAEAARWYRLSAEQGFTDARFFLAQALETGEGLPKNIQEAIDWYILAAEDGHKSARLKLWALAIGGVFQPEDIKEEIFIEEIGVEAGSPLALFKQGYRYDLGIGLKRDPEKAIKMYEMSAEKGFFTAFTHIQLWREYKRGGDVFSKVLTPQRPLKATTEALEPLWMYLEDNVHDLVEVSRYREHYVKADSGVKESMSELAIHFYFGKGVKVNFSEALKWAELGASVGEPYCQYLFGYMKIYGEGTPIDKTIALDNLLKASKADYPHAKRLAADLLLELSDDKKSISQAIKMLKELAESGDASAQFTLGYRYSNGQKVRKSERLAIHYYRMSADQGNASALFNLAIKYEYGQGVEKDIATAISLYRGAAENGLARACETMAKFYAEGESVAKDLKEADRWTKLAEQYKAKAESDNAKHITHNGRSASNGNRRERLMEKRSLKVKDQMLVR